MPKNTDIKSILVIGSGPISIGQGCEFDYSGTQALKALREEGYRVILINSNPATIMTDPELADATYIEPITHDYVAAIIEKERPDALIATLGGQTSLNCAMALHDSGLLERFQVNLIGVSVAESLQHALCSLDINKSGFDELLDVDNSTLKLMLKSHYSNHIWVVAESFRRGFSLAAYSTIPIINGLSALYHPCQVLADLLTLQYYFNTLSGLTLAYIGDGNNILHSLMQLAPAQGITVRYCCPEDNQPNQHIVKQQQAIHGDKIVCCLTPQEAVLNVHAVYTDVWTSMGFEEQTNIDNFKAFQVNESLMSYAKPEAIFMHCMPMERGKETSVTLPDDPRSAIFTQSENRLHAQKALLLFLQGIIKV